MIDLVEWRIVLRHQVARTKAVIPPNIMTAGARFRHENMPVEVSLLLPVNHGPMALIETVARDPAPFRNTILGLFLANPFLNAAHEARRLADSGIGWIANLPSVAQQDEEFSRQLSDIDLDQTCEFAALERFRAAGFKIATVVADATGGIAACAIEPELIIVLPRIADFAAGFPSMRQRGSAAQAVHRAVRAAPWGGLLLCLGDKSEIEHETLWPVCVDGLICRPSPLAETS